MLHREVVEYHPWRSSKVAGTWAWTGQPTLGIPSDAPSNLNHYVILLNQLWLNQDFSKGKNNSY